MGGIACVWTARSVFQFFPHTQRWIAGWSMLNASAAVVAGSEPVQAGVWLSDVIGFSLNSAVEGEPSRTNNSENGGGPLFFERSVGRQHRGKDQHRNPS